MLLRKQYLTGSLMEHLLRLCFAACWLSAAVCFVSLLTFQQSPGRVLPRVQTLSCCTAPMMGAAV